MKCNHRFVSSHLRFFLCGCFLCVFVHVTCQTSDSRGEALIRPSSKGPDHLSLTWMWLEGEFMHTDIQVRFPLYTRAEAEYVAPECVDMRSIREVFVSFLEPPIVRKPEHLPCALKI